MIKIKESKPIKISGETSLFLSFPFNPSIISVIKGCSSYQFHDKLRIWEAPVTSLAYLLDNLVFYDSVDLELLSDNNDIEYSHPIEVYPEWLLELIKSLYDTN